MSLDELEPLDVVLRRHGLAGKVEEPFPNNGWSGAAMSRIRRAGGDRFIVKRDSLARDWIARATRDRPVLREAWLAARSDKIAEHTMDAVRAPYLGVARDGDDVVTVMPDLSGVLFDWEAPITIEAMDAVLSGLARLHAPTIWPFVFEDAPWCPLRERVLLICRPSLELPGPAGDAVAERLLPGWDAFDRHATPAARHLIEWLARDVDPLLRALEGQERTLIHGDLKLANAGIAADGALELVDWQMVSLAPIAVEIGWFLVANVSSLPVPPEEVLFRYRRHLADGYRDVDDGWLEGHSFDDAGVDAAILVGLLLRGWRKGLDAEAGITLASGVSAADDLAWWCERAVEAADRLF